jgi:hypothetical protein
VLVTRRPLELGHDDVQLGLHPGLDTRNSSVNRGGVDGTDHDGHDLSCRSGDFPAHPLRAVDPPSLHRGALTLEFTGQGIGQVDPGRRGGDLEQLRRCHRIHRALIEGAVRGEREPMFVISRSLTPATSTAGGESFPEAATTEVGERQSAVTEPYAMRNDARPAQNW